MGVSVMTVLEIFNHPDDLAVEIPKEKNGSKFAILISRGPGHNYKMLLSSKPVFETFDSAIDSVEKILKEIMEYGKKEVVNKESLIYAIVNPDGLELDQIDESGILNAGLITRIMDELRKKQCADTHEMLATTATG